MFSLKKCQQNHFCVYPVKIPPNPPPPPPPHNLAYGQTTLRFYNKASSL